MPFKIDISLYTNMCLHALIVSNVCECCPRGEELTFFYLLRVKEPQNPGEARGWQVQEEH